MKRILAFLCVVSVHLSSQAVPMIYTDEALFLAAIGGAADVSEDFNVFNTDQSFRNSSYDVGPFTLSSSGADQNSGTQNTIDASPFVFDSFANVDGTTFAHFFIHGSNGTTASIGFDDAITGFGATFKQLDTATDITLATTAGSLVIDQNIGSGIGFFGFTLDLGVTATSLTFSRTSFSDGFGMDNVLLETGVSVPAPATLALFGLGLAGLGWRKRKNA
ncbi:PEP-CTERM sorting domain-containing protein [Congregibacter sp.]|jgi:hypothetical protein|uniref:PEP-CTERM sorting domain-containing protein n=1 Tax=Congregibacter sp. TaxID=2744308 RepID=UPI0039E3E3C1